jgi:predicted transcriptional regulator
VQRVVGLRNESIYANRFAMNSEKNLIDSLNGESEAEADAQAEADVRAGRLISHSAVRRWLKSWGTPNPLPRPRVGD